MTVLKKISLVAVTSLILSSCGSSDKSNQLVTDSKSAEELKTEGNGVNQSNPALMVIPSDALLKRLGCLKEIENQGTTSYARDYNKAFVNDSELKFVFASIEETFSKAGYPLENLEQQLKSINNEKTMDDVEELSKDARTLLMNTVRPDFVIEVDYEYKQDPTSRNPKKILTYIVTALDAYTNKSVAAITRADIGKESNGSGFAALIKEDMTTNMGDFLKQISTRFSDELANGIEVTLRLTAEKEFSFNFGDECLGTENYNDWINSWLKKNTINSSFKSVKNTDKELKYTSVRIGLKDANGERFTTFDFANNLRKDFAKGCGIKVSNRTQGLGDAYLVVTGLK